MPRYTRTKAIRKQEAIARNVWIRAARRIRRDLRAEWQAGRAAPIDTLSVVQAAEQWRLKVKMRREVRREQQRRRRPERVAA